MQRFQPRPYQTTIIRKIEEENCKKLLIVYPRRAGKDIVAFNIAIRQCLRKMSTVFYVFPTFGAAKRILWDAIDDFGHRVLDWYCPDELCISKNSSELKIEFKNGSILKMVGSKKIDSIVGINFQGVIYSEYAVQSPDAFLYLAPISTANQAWTLIISTPRGHTHMYDMYERARHSKDWYVSKLTVEDTKHIPLSEIRKLKDDGIMSDDLIQQEFYCSFDLGIVGSYYCKIIDQLRLNDQIGTVMYDSSFPVSTAWDLGVKDMTSIVFVQVIGNSIRLIDYYENTGKGLDHYAQVVLSKPYVYKKHIAPHDIKVREWAGGAQTRIDKARQLGISFSIAPNISIADGIEAVKTMLPKCFIDEVKCKLLIKALENYHREYNEDRKQYADKPFHDWSSNGADCVRYLAISLARLQSGTSAEELDKRYKDAMMLNDTASRPFKKEPW